MTEPVRGLLDHLEQASHISAGMGCTFRAALEIVKAAEAHQAKPEQSTEWANVIWGTVFGGRRS
ncbi:hypothetical protein [Bradyrhizobium sp. CCBAU 51627]|uniref:hypothetical protein n=1 Tax=Bradyrhizobium sp. CCBAU 51627 TaxID=1325088 RepID=UPI0023056572|nr:hypothetical protein [Bradyrhizobium sp. CCBAU 51627]MDA9437258.1 hypothetical protein [Bradyrhizobium sp. CCBAU 51627]